MIISVTLNAAIDRTVAVPNLRLGHRHRSVETRTVPGGGGHQRGLRPALLGRPVIATGLVGGGNGDRVLKQLGEEASHRFHPDRRRDPLQPALVDPTTGEQTEVNERGFGSARKKLDSFIERLDYLASGASLAFWPAARPGHRCRVLRAVWSRRSGRPGLPVLLDSGGEAMSAGMRAGPDMITRTRWRPRAGRPRVRHPGGNVGVLAELVDMGPAEVAITLPEGCVAIVGRGAEPADPRSRDRTPEPISTVGSGDAFVAGYIAARYDGGTPEDCPATASPAGGIDPAPRRRADRPRPGRKPARQRRGPSAPASGEV